MSLFKKILLILGLCLLIDRTLGFIFYGISKHSSFRFSELYTGSINADVLFVGNSIAVNAFHAPTFNKKTDMTAFNLSFNGLTFPLTEILITDYLENNEKPQVIFIEISGLSNVPSDLLANFKQFMSNSELLSARLKKIHPPVYYASLVSKTFSYNSEFFLRTVYYLFKDDQAWINKNFIPESTYSSLTVETRHELLLRPMSSLEIDQFRNLASSMASKGIIIVPVMAPIIDKYYDAYEVNSYVQNFENDTGLKVLNLAGLIDDFEMFADSIHTNLKAAPLIMEHIIRNTSNLKEF